MDSRFIIGKAAAVLLSLNANAGELNDYLFETSPSSWRSSYESITLPAGDQMGLIGLHYDTYPFDGYPSTYFGIGGYGGASGEEGGFFTMGGTIGTQYHLTDKLGLDLGLHFGGGGGSDLTFPGDGMVLRGHAMLEFPVRNYQLRFGISHTDFPSSSRSPHADTNFSAGVRINTRGWSSHSNTDNLTPNYFSGRTTRLRVLPSLMYYVTDDEQPVNRNGSYSGDATSNADFALLGMQLDYFFSEQAFTTLETYGATGGGAGGYASFSTGLGYRLPLTHRIAWENRATIGLAGDGRIDTGGGSTVHLFTGASINLSKHWYLKGMIGRISALDGKLGANVFDLGLGWQANVPTPNRSGIFRFDPENYRLLKWQLSLGHKSYFPDSLARNNQGLPYENSQQLIGLEVSRPFTEWFALHGNTHWAYEGGIGSYAEAMFGLSVSPEFLRAERARFRLGYDIGVGGGGDMALDDGVIQQLTAALEYRIARNLSVELRAGAMQSLGGAYDADVLQLQFNWDQATAISRL